MSVRLDGGASELPRFVLLLTAPFLNRTPVIVLSSAISKSDRKQLESFSVARHIIKAADLANF
jgi:hypothetical protein